MHYSGLTSFCIFDFIDKIKFFLYNTREDLIKHSDALRNIFDKYNYILFETVNPNLFKLYEITE